MRNSAKTVLLAAIILIFSGALSADDYHESGMATKYDYDRDGLITLAEYDKAFEKKMKAKLEWLDKNNDGVATPGEFRDQHRLEFNHRWSMWDADGDGVVSVDAILKQKQESRAEMRRTKANKD
jgi:hypothetical protein